MDGWMKKPMNGRWMDGFTGTQKVDEWMDGWWRMVEAGAVFRASMLCGALTPERPEERAGASFTRV